MVVCCNFTIDRIDNYDTLLAIIIIIHKSMVIFDTFRIILDTSMVILIIFIKCDLIDIINCLSVQQHLILHLVIELPTIIL